MRLYFVEAVPAAIAEEIKEKTGQDIRAIKYEDAWTVGRFENNELAAYI